MCGSRFIVGGLGGATGFGSSGLSSVVGCAMGGAVKNISCFLPNFSFERRIILSRLSFLRAGRGRVRAGKGAEVISSIESLRTISCLPSDTRSFAV